ncbi:MAG: endonuclease III [Solirubrobacterales bacterium]
MAKMTRNHQTIYDRLLGEYPNAGPRLHFSNTFELLAATILSAQSTDDQVNALTPRLFQEYGTAEKMASAPLESVEELIKGCGLFHSKAKHLIGASQRLVAAYNGRVPDRFEDLLTLPGVGRKTANVVISVAFGQPGLAVDTHVQRVSTRLGLTGSTDPDKTEKALKAAFRPELWGKLHHLFIWHGRSVCTARKPRCGSCVLAEQCPSKEND